MNPSVTLAVLVGAAVVYGFLNGYKDAASITATVISSRAMSPRHGLAVVGICEFCGPFLFGMAVATALGQGLITEAAVTPAVLLAALGAAITWSVCMVLLGLPASSTHSLIGGLIGAAWAGAGPQAVYWGGVLRVLAFLFLSPVLGAGLGYVALRVILFFLQGATPGINLRFKQWQVFTASAVALSQGSNDAQKSIGMIALALLATGQTTTFQIPLWAVGLGAGALALGAFMGGERVIRTVGGKIYRIRPVHAFAAQAASTVIVLGSGLLGGPVSTTQVVSSAVIGVGSAQRPSAVHWGTVRRIALAWMVTLPATAFLAALLWQALSRLMVM